MEIHYTSTEMTGRYRRSIVRGVLPGQSAESIHEFIAKAHPLGSAFTAGGGLIIPGMILNEVGLEMVGRDAYSFELRYVPADPWLTNTFEVDPRLLDGASLHFTSPTIHRRTEPLTPQEAEALVSDDESARINWQQLREVRELCRLLDAAGMSKPRGYMLSHPLDRNAGPALIEIRHGRPVITEAMAAHMPCPFPPGSDADL